MYRMNLMLADSAQVVGGKLFVLGGGWSLIVPGGPFAVCGIIDIPWHQGTDWHTLRLELIDGDGESVYLPVDGEDEPKPVVIDLPSYRPTIGPHVKPGTALTWPFAINVPPGMPLEPQSIYEWRLSIDGKNEEGWTLPFSTLPSQPMPQAA